MGSVGVDVLLGVGETCRGFLFSMSGRNMVGLTSSEGEMDYVILSVVMVVVPSDAATCGATPIPLGLRECS